VIPAELAAPAAGPTWQEVVLWIAGGLGVFALLVLAMFAIIAGLIGRDR
jgi:hypothetical protein